MVRALAETDARIQQVREGGIVAEPTLEPSPSGAVEPKRAVPCFF